MLNSKTISNNSKKGGISHDLLFTEFVHAGFPIVRIDSRSTSEVSVKIPLRYPYSGDPYMEIALLAMLHSLGNYVTKSLIDVTYESGYVKFILPLNVRGRIVDEKSIVDQIVQLCGDNDFEGFYENAKDITKIARFMVQTIQKKGGEFVGITLYSKDLDTVMDFRFSGKISDSLEKAIDASSGMPIKHMKLNLYRSTETKPDTFYDWNGNGAYDWGVKVLINPGCDVESDINQTFNLISKLL